MVIADVGCQGRGCLLWRPTVLLACSALTSVNRVRMSLVKLFNRCDTAAILTA